MIIIKITIDTEKKIIVVPNTYYKNIDKMNDNIRLGGGTPVDYVQFIKDVFEEAINNPLKRTADVATGRKKTEATIIIK